MPNDFDLTLPQNGLGDDCAPCGLHRPMRNAYYDGKMLTAVHLTSEQTYMNGMRHLGNMMLEGKGTVCGLKVLQHPQDGCRSSHLVLQAGMALSCCGQEIVVPSDVTIPVLEMLQADPDLQEALADGSNELVVQICRDDKAAEMGPVLISDCCSGLDGQLPSRIAEDFGFRLKAEPKGTTTTARTVLEPDLSWVHSINTGDEVPRAVAIDEGNDLVFVGSQASTGDDTSVATVRAYSMTTHRHVATLQGWDEVTDIVTPQVGNWMFVAGHRDGTYMIATYPRNPDHLAPIVSTRDSSGPLQLAVSPVTGALFALEYHSTLGWPKLRAWSAEQIDGGFVDLSFKKQKRVAMDTEAFDAGCRAIEISPDGQRLAVSLPGVAPSTVRVAEVSELMSGGIADLDQMAITIRSESGSNITAAYIATASVRFSFDGSVLHCAGRDLDTPDKATYRAISLGDGANTQLGGGLRFDFPSVQGLHPSLYVAPDERWIYVSTASDLRLGTGAEDGRLWAYATKAAQAPGTVLIDGAAVASVPLNAQTSGGAIRLRGQRIYVPGIQALIVSEEDEVETGPIVGRVMVVDITEADIKGLFEEAIDGCHSCGEACCCVTVAHLPDYIYNQEEPMRMVDAGTGLEGDAEIDNLTYRHIVPSNTKLMEAILEIAARGVDAGPPGPRGRDGANGSNGTNGTNGTDGTNGTNGVDGARGGSIQEVAYASTITEPSTTVIPGDPEGDLLLRLPHPIDDVRYENVSAPSITADRVLILPEPEDGGGGGIPPRDPTEYHFVESVDWKHADVYGLESAGNAPPDTVQIALNLPTSTPDAVFTTLSGTPKEPDEVAVFSGVLEVRVTIFDQEFSFDPVKVSPFNVGAVNTLRYAPKFDTREQAFPEDRIFTLDMADLWRGLRNYWENLDIVGSRARVELLVHGNFLENARNWPFDGRAKPDATPENAGTTGGTWRSWIDVKQF